ncbi:MAG: kelch repeat-containing protein, partial [Pseudomonadota bacterium]
MRRKEVISMKRLSFSSLVIVGLLVTELLIWAIPAASQDTPGVWKLAGSMSTARRYGGDARLRDGRIIAMGGTDTTGVDGTASIFYNTAEIYDPVTATWTAANGLTTGERALFSVAGLPKWKILLTGGWNGSAALSSADVYDPDTESFSATGFMNVARREHRSTMLFDGRVLITGGFNSVGTPLATAEIYDPVAGTFSYTTGPMAAARGAHRMNTVGDGKILITGGFGVGGFALASAELFDPVTKTFSPAGSLGQARARHSATQLPTGEILIAGGNSGSAVLASTEIYNPDSKAFSPGLPLNQARQTHSAQVLPNGKVLFSGGNNNPSGAWDIQTNFLSSCELYDRKTNTMTTTGSKTNATSAGLPYLLWTGKFMYAGGGTNETELYTPDMPGTLETWEPGGTMATGRTEAFWSALDDGTVLVSGGFDSAGNVLASAEVYDYLTGAFTATAGPMSTPRQQHRTVQLYTGKVLVSGGRSDPNTTLNGLNSAELYDPATGTFGPAGPSGTPATMLRYRRLHRSTELANGKILITGGLGGTASNGSGVLNSAEIYDPATGNFAWAAGGPPSGGMTVARRSHQAILLRTGKVLIAGGYTTGTPNVLLDSAELYDPDTDSFSATLNTMSAARAPFLTMLPDGKVLVSNGSDASGAPIGAADIYDPATNRFTSPGNELLARDGNRVTRLPGGKIMLVGGKTTSNPTPVTDSVELYSHLIRTFTYTDNLITGRRNFVLANLADGRILVAGGVDGTAPNGAVLSSVELYTPLIADEVDTTITSGPDAVTDSTGATFEFTSSPAGGTFKCSLDNAVFETCISGKTYNSLLGGSHRFQVYATDLQGNVDPTPAIYNWTIIETRITSHPAAKTKKTSAEFAFDSTAAGSTFECSLDNAAFSGCTSPKVYPKLKPGNHKFQVRASKGGHPDPTPANCDWTIDTKLPNTIITSAPPKLTNDPRATFEFISTEEGSTFECSMDGGGFVACVSPWTSDILSDGKHSFQVRAIDAAENLDKSAAKAKVWTVDTIAPATTIILPKT